MKLITAPPLCSILEMTATTATTANNVKTASTAGNDPPRQGKKAKTAIGRRYMKQ